MEKVGLICPGNYEMAFIVNWHTILLTFLNTSPFLCCEIGKYRRVDVFGSLYVIYLRIYILYLIQAIENACPSSGLLRDFSDL